MSNPVKNITVLDFNLEVSAPYSEGHPLTANEALSLNQTRAENIGNNVRSKIKAFNGIPEGEEKTAAEAALRAEVAQYDAEYVFNTRSARGSATTMSPLEKAALKLAGQILLNKLREGKVTKKEYVEKNGEDYVEAKIAEIAAMEPVMAEAKKLVAQQEKRASSLAQVAI